MSVSCAGLPQEPHFLAYASEATCSLTSPLTSGTRLALIFTLHALAPPAGAVAAAKLSGLLREWEGKSVLPALRLAAVEQGFDRLVVDATQVASGEKQPPSKLVHVLRHR